PPVWYDLQMADYRTKTMTLAEWPAFRKSYEDFFAASGRDKRLALFIHADEKAADKSLLLIPGFQSGKVEALSPGGWQDAGDVSGKAWGVLVGNDTANADFGLTPPVVFHGWDV
ncbi:MAG: hypothetical protein PHE36_11445, partial [Novosphingobium sp.]|nr:hypothetical protein [Novosphingobium sp.]